MAFDSRPMTKEEISLLIEAAKWAPSGRNAQPWRFIYATRDMNEYGPMFDLLNPGNKVWAKTAPLLILPIAMTISTYKERPNRLALYETGMAVSNLLFQATHMGLFVHQMGGYDHEKARELLGIPARFEPTAMMAVGYKGDLSALPAELAERETTRRTRMETGTFLVRGGYGTT